MNTYELTHHAQVRCQQRGIKAETLNVLLAYGRRRRHRGADVYYMDKTARRRARGELSDSVHRRIADKLNAYAVVTSECIVLTVAKRWRRLKF